MKKKEIYKKQEYYLFIESSLRPIFSVLLAAEVYLPIWAHLKTTSVLGDQTIIAFSRAC